MASTGSNSRNSHKRRLDSFLQSIGSRTSSPSRPGSRISARPDDPPSTPTPSSPADMLESLNAKRQRLGLDSSSYANWSTASSTMSSPASSILKKWSTRSTTTGAPGSAFSNNRNSILLVNSTTQTPVAKRLVPPAPVLYSPGDRDALIARLATFQDLTDWTPKPERASEIEWAKKGWVCRGRERVACSLCKRELVVGLNRKEVDGKEVSVLVASEIEEALVDKYVEMMVTEHLEDCPWRKLGCDDSLLRVPLNNSKDALADLRTRYGELLERKDFLPYDFNLRLPADLDLDSVLLQLPPDFFSSNYLNPDDTAPVIEEPPHRVALSLALFGWQRLSNPRMGTVRDTVSCHTCLRRLGLWMFKPKQVGLDGTVISPAPMDHLDPAAEHRFFCPWKNADAQRLDYSAPNPATDAAAWPRLVQIIRNEASIRGAFDRKRSKSFIARRLGGGSSIPSTPARGADADVPPSTAGADSTVTDDGEDDEQARDAKEKAMYSRLRRIKSLFIPKDKDKGKTSRPSSRASMSKISSPTPAADQARA